MAAVIRFTRAGTKRKPHFRIVVQDKARARDGKFIENLGTFHPRTDATPKVDRPRFEYWLKNGAQMSLSLKNRIKSQLRDWAQQPPEVGGPK